MSASVPKIWEERGQDIENITKLLATGPVIIGEDHTQKTARRIIARLAKTGVLKHLSIEGPILQASFRTEGNFLAAEHVDTYRFGHTFVSNEQYPMSKLIMKSALHTKGVIFHDIPPVYQYNTVLEDENAKNQMMKSFASIDVRESTPGLKRKLAKGFSLSQRNIFANAFLQNNLGAHYNQMAGLGILCGSDHTRPGVCEFERTLQRVCGIGDERVFVFDS